MTPTAQGFDQRYAYEGKSAQKNRREVVLRNPLSAGGGAGAVAGRESRVGSGNNYDNGQLSGANLMESVDVTSNRVSMQAIGFKK